ncbi:hypothetical protein [Neisseria dentiae]|uniref:hypothetical protein n=1 Tax=Neisseria dentiae TaxID=194197 RepID=UPI000E021592|nr:hypothetical protein [Neisseria dentiae]QMT44469.1 hypothetical protein H3L92_08315 [Neisseria dentiae]STZ50163.1 Uncharacterised protein [Neisseria dentiae]
MHTRLKLPLLALCSSTLLLCACGPNEAVAMAAAPPAAAASAETVASYRGNLLEDAAALQAAQDALKNLPPFRGKAVNVFDNIDFFDGVRPRIEADIQNPDRPEKIDHYVYDQGRWRYTDTLRIPPEGLDIPKKLTPLSRVRFADAAAVAAAWSQKARSMNAVVTEPYFVSYVLLDKERKRFWHTATIEAVGEQYYLSFHADGSVWEFKKLGREGP